MAHTPTKTGTHWEGHVAEDKAWLPLDLAFKDQHNGSKNLHITNQELEICIYPKNILK